MKTISDFNVSGKRVFVRCDFNIPLSEKGDILDDFRILKALPTIKRLRIEGAKVILGSHLGRPGGTKQEALCLTPVYQALIKRLGQPIVKTDECIGKRVKEQIEALPEAGVLLLENLRFQKEEEENNRDFARELACLADIYINDAFSVSHRNHASIVGIPEFLPSGIGLLFEQELMAFYKILKSPERPLIGIIGGAKLPTKIEPINEFLEVVDFLLVAGKVANAILLSKLNMENKPGIDAETEKELELFSLDNPKLLLPVDGVKENGQIFDIGPKTVRMFTKYIKQAKTIFWAGPLGKIEENRFRAGTLAVAKAIANSKAESIAGGRETVGFIRDSGLEKKFSYLSTGGGAMLDYLSHGTLPGIESIENQ